MRQVVRKVYRDLVERHTSHDLLQKKWSKTFNCDISKSEMQIAFDSIKKTTVIGKLRSFQYRLLRRAIFTNTHLKRWGLRETDRCSFCEIHEETVIHLFCECPNVQPLWSMMTQMAAEFCGADEECLKLSIRNVIFNQVFSTNVRNVVNLLCLITKQYIYRQRCTKNNLSARELKRLILSYRNSEKYYAIKNNTTNAFFRRWDSKTNVIPPNSFQLEEE